MRKYTFGVLFLSSAISLLGQQQVVDFEQFEGPQVSGPVQPPLSVAGATFSGGEIIRNGTNLPADESTIYGTTDFCSGCLPAITINFAQGVSGFSLLLINGETFVVTYIVFDDQGGSQTIKQVENFSEGAGYVFLPESNIRSVEIAPLDTSNGWDFFIDNVTFTPSSMSLVDPSQGNVVQGVASDGVTQVWVQIPANRNGEHFNVTIYNDQDNPSGSTDQDGALAAGLSLPVASSITVQADASTSSGPTAFAVYRAPIDFSRGGADDQAASRVVYIQASSLDTPGYTLSMAVTILRPPVVLVHGLWSDNSAWNSFTPLVTDSRFFIRYADYSRHLTGIISTVPNDYNPSDLSKATQSALGFGPNAPLVLSQVFQSINDFKQVNNVAAIQADIVAHSMGGDIARTMRSLPDFLSGDTYGQGTIHKLITIGTPHLGTPLATQLLSSDNNCVRGLLKHNGNIAFSSVTTSSGTENGGVGDLEGDGYGGGLSMALGDLQASFVHPIPTALIAGVTNQSNLSNLECTFCWTTLFHLCGNPLGGDLTTRNWVNVFGQANDAIVPLTSQWNGLTGIQVAGVVHSSSVEGLGFNGPAELDQSPGIPLTVIYLLNEPLTGFDYHPL